MLDNEQEKDKTIKCNDPHFVTPYDVQHLTEEFS